MHTTYIHIHTQEGGGKSLKNTKINYTRSSASLLANFLGRFLKIFFCVLQVSVLAKSVIHSLQISSFVVLFLSTLKCRPPVLILGLEAHSDDITRRLESSTMTIDSILDEANLFWAKKERKKKLCPLSVEDKCFICFHTNFSSRLNYCLHSLFQHCTSFHVVSLYIPPRIHKTKTKNKR